jgi:hypothetical protein
MKDGRRFGRPPDAVELPLVPEGRINTSDPDSRVMRTQGQPAVQGYNAQAAVTDRQIIVAAEVTTDSPDFGHFEPTVKAMLRDLERAGVNERPTTVLADAGYWHKEQIEAVIADGIQVLIPPDGGLREGARPGWEGGLYSWMRRVLASEHGQALYRTRKRIEPVFGQIKHNRKADRFQRRGRAAARGMATDRCHPQPPQAPSPLDRRHLTKAALTRTRHRNSSAKPPSRAKTLPDGLGRRAAVRPVRRVRAILLWTQTDKCPDPQTTSPLRVSGREPCAQLLRGQR